MTYALIKDGKLVRMAENILDASTAFTSGEADGIHYVKDLEELNSVLKFYEGAEPGEQPEVLTNTMNQVIKMVETIQENIANNAQKLGQTGQEKYRNVIDILGRVKVKAQESIRETAEKVRDKVHQATAPASEAPEVPEE